MKSNISHHKSSKTIIKNRHILALQKETGRCLQYLHLKSQSRPTRWMKKSKTIRRHWMVLILLLPFFLWMKVRRKRMMGTTHRCRIHWKTSTIIRRHFRWLCQVKQHTTTWTTSNHYKETLISALLSNISCWAQMYLIIQCSCNPTSTNNWRWVNCQITTKTCQVNFCLNTCLNKIICLCICSHRNSLSIRITRKWYSSISKWKIILRKLWMLLWTV